MSWEIREERWAEEDMRFDYKKKRFAPSKMSFYTTKDSPVCLEKRFNNRQKSIVVTKESSSGDGMK